MGLHFENRYQAINFYKQEWSKVDQDLQDFVVHHQKLIEEKIMNSTKKLKDLRDLIEWNKSELKKETRRQSSDNEDGVYD